MLQTKTMETKKILAIIPARGGSKAIPQKNSKLLAGKPLIAYTINEALKSKYLNRVIVSTDDNKISEISKKYGAEVIKRPDILSGDKSKGFDAILNVIDTLKKEKYVPDAVVWLQPTSPLRIVEDIDNAVRIFLKRSKESVISVCEAKSSAVYWSFKIKGEHLKPVFNKKYLDMRRQELNNIYIPNGAIYISSTKNLLKYKSFYCKSILPYIMLPERSIDIDEESDFELAEIIIGKLNEQN